MSSDATQSHGALHPLLRRAVDLARTENTSVLVRIPAPRPPQDPWDLAQRALSSGQRATVWSDPDQAMLAVGVGETFRLEGAGDTRLLDLDAQFQDLRTVSHPLLEDLPLWFGGFSFDHRRPATGVWASWPAAELITHAITAIHYQRKSYLVLSVFVEPTENEQALQRQYEALQEQLKDLSAVAPAHEVPTLHFNELDRQDHWDAQVIRAQSAIEEDTLQKIVLARRMHAPWETEATATSERGAHVAAALQTLRRRYQHCTTFALARDEDDGASIFFGATPELLAARKERVLHTMALAGTAPRGNGYADDERQRQELLASPKERQEHQFVVQDIQQNLARIGIDVHVPSAPDVVSFPNVHHLKTPIRGKDATTLGLLPIANALHPTPAICGTPTHTTYAWLHDHEEMERGWYAGGVMWLNDRGDGRVNVALRSAVADADGVCAYAGAGIVEGSDAQQEWEETRAKLSPICDAFVPLTPAER